MDRRGRHRLGARESQPRARGLAGDRHHGDQPGHQQHAGGGLRGRQDDEEHARLDDLPGREQRRRCGSRARQSGCHGHGAGGDDHPGRGLEDHLSLEQALGLHDGGHQGQRHRAQEHAPRRGRREILPSPRRSRGATGQHHHLRRRAREFRHQHRQLHVLLQRDRHGQNPGSHQQRQRRSRRHHQCPHPQPSRRRLHGEHRHRQGRYPDQPRRQPGTYLSWSRHPVHEESLRHVRRRPRRPRRLCLQHQQERCHHRRKSRTATAVHRRLPVREQGSRQRRPRGHARLPRDGDLCPGGRLPHREEDSRRGLELHPRRARDQLVPHLVRLYDERPGLGPGAARGRDGRRRCRRRGWFGVGWRGQRRPERRGRRWSQWHGWFQKRRSERHGRCAQRWRDGHRRRGNRRNDHRGWQWRGWQRRGWQWRGWQWRGWQRERRGRGFRRRRRRGCDGKRRQHQRRRRRWRGWRRVGGRLVRPGRNPGVAQWPAPAWDVAAASAGREVALSAWARASCLPHCLPSRCAAFSCGETSSHRPRSRRTSRPAPAPAACPARRGP